MNQYIFSLLFVSQGIAYEPVKFEDLGTIDAKKIEIYSEITTDIWVHHSNQDTVISGVAVVHHEFEPGLLESSALLLQPNENPVCGYGCRMSTGLMVINDKYLISVPCGFEDTDDLILLFYPKGKKCVEYKIKKGVKKFIKGKGKITPFQDLIFEYRKMRKINLRTE